MHKLKPYARHHMRSPAPPKAPEAALQDMATEILKQPEQLQRYNQVLWQWVGHPLVEARLAGQHPWLEYRNGGRRVGSIPVLAAFSPEAHSLLVVKKDHWHHQNDTDAWTARQLWLRTGKSWELRIQSAAVEQVTRRMWLRFAPPGTFGDPPQLRRDQTRIVARLNPDYYASEATIHYGLRARQTYQDISILHGALQQLVQSREEVIRSVPDLAEDVPSLPVVTPPAVA